MTFLLSLLVLLVVSAVVAYVLISLSTRLAGIRNDTFGKSLRSAVYCTAAAWTLAGAFSWVPVGGTLFGFAAGLVASLWILKAIYETTFKKAFLMFLFNTIAQVLSLGLALLFFGATLLAWLIHYCFGSPTP